MAFLFYFLLTIFANSCYPSRQTNFFLFDGKGFFIYFLFFTDISKKSNIIQVPLHIEPRPNIAREKSSSKNTSKKDMLSIFILSIKKTCGIRRVVAFQNLITQR